MRPSPHELTCRQLVELVTAYFDGALDPDERARFEAHLESCSGCRAYLEQMRRTLEVVRAAPDPEARPEVAGLLRAFREHRRAAHGEST